VILLAVILLIVFTSIPAPWNVVVLAIAAVLEVFEIGLLRRWSKRLDKSTARTTGAEALIGEVAEVVQPCRPVGQVKVRGELWEARCDEGADTGETVKVKSLSGLALVVVR
jgi:membrane protein implicated in regulation of membrane protease activity